MADLTTAVLKYIKDEYGGSQDLRQFDALELCSYFHKHYAAAEQRCALKASFVELERYISQLEGGTWHPAAEVSIVPQPDPANNPRFLIAPWQVGLTAERHSIKGKSQHPVVLDLAQRFLVDPYNSAAEPLHILSRVPLRRVQRPKTGL